MAYAGKKMKVLPGMLMAKLYRLGISATQASCEMGFSSSYLSICFKRGWMPEYAVQIIYDRYGIQYSEYAKDQTPDEPKEMDDPSLDLILEELRTIRATLQMLCEDR